MAMNIDQATNAFENNAAMLMPTKTMDRNESGKKKVALGDIKNAPTAPTSDGKTTMKKVEIEQMDDDNEDYDSVSSKPVDYFQAWVEKAAFTDEEINKWIKMLNTPLFMDPAEEIEPPKPEEPEEEFYPESEQEMPIPPELPDSPPMTPNSSSSEYHSFESDFEDEVTPPQNVNFYSDSDLSALNRSVFELSSEFEDSFSE